MRIFSWAQVPVALALSTILCVVLCISGFGGVHQDSLARTKSIETESKSDSHVRTVKRPDKLLLSDQKEKTIGLVVKRPEVEQAASTEFLELSSTVEAPLSATGTIYSPVVGVVTKVLVDVGDFVTTGQVVAYVESPQIADAQAEFLDALARVSQIQAQMLATRSRLELSEANQARINQLKLEGIASQKDVESAKGAVAAIQCELAACEGSLRAAQAHLIAGRSKLRSIGVPEPSKDRAESYVSSNLAIRSMVTGTVVRRDVFAGQSVGPSASLSPGSAAKQNSSLMMIANLKVVWVMLEVPQREVSKVKVGSVVEFYSESIPNRKFIGKITRLAQTFDPHSRTALVRAEIANPGQLLKPGMLVIARIRMMLSTACMVVPVDAVQKLNGETYVFLRTNPHEYALRKVDCAERTDKGISIVSGLKESDWVVTKGAFYLKCEMLRPLIKGDAP